MVGSALIRKLLAKGCANIVSNYHSRAPEKAPLADVGLAASGAKTEVRWTQLDLARQSDTETFYEQERPEYVFLAAAKVGGILANDTYKAEFIYDNLAIATNVINGAHKSGVRKLLNLGSSCIYPRLAPQPLKEECLLTGPLEPTNEPYAIAKIAAIKLCRYFNEQYATNFISVMPTNLYGPNDNFNLETAHVLPALIRKFHLAKLLSAADFEGIAADIHARPLGFGLDGRLDLNDKTAVTGLLEKLGITGEAVTLWGTGEPFREFLYVDDLAQGALFLFERYDAKDLGELVNIGCGEDMRIGDMARMVKEITGFRGSIVYDSTKPDGMPRKLLDISALKRLGWEPETGLREGIGKAYGWYASGQD
jgi:GDP-L-fucose synthase